jgi:hypothetical protein
VGVQMRRNTARMSLYVIFLGLALSAPALAQPPGLSAADADLSAQAMELYNEGLKAAKLGQWDKARTFYLGAWRVQHHPQIAANLGRAELKSGKHRDAAEHLTYFLREAPSIDPADRKRTQELLVEARAKVGTLTIAVNRDGAEIRIDGTSAGAAPLKGEVFVEPGRHSVEARLEGYMPTQATQELRAGSEARVDLQFAPTELRKPEAAMLPIPPTQDEEQRGGPKKTVVLVGTAASIAALGATVGFSIASENKRAERGKYRDYCYSHAACDQYNNAEDARASFGNAAITSAILAGILGAGTLTYVLVTQPKKPQTAARANLVLGAGTAGAMVTVPW